MVLCQEINFMTCQWTTHNLERVSDWLDSFHGSGSLLKAWLALGQSEEFHVCSE